MILDRTHLITFIAGAIVGLLTGFFIGKGIYDRPIKESVTRDTVRITDTIPHYYPQPVDGTVVRYITRYLPTAKRDTASRVDHFRDFTQKVEHLRDTTKMIAVEVPITSKHYGSKDYDAWVSGYEPSLDSIKVYKENQYITNTITRTVKDKGKHFFLDVGAGCEYQFNTKTAVPFAELGARLKFGRVGIGAYGGYAHDIKENKALPIVKAKVTYDIMCF
jgi:hypothetical protein